MSDLAEYLRGIDAQLFRKQRYALDKVIFDMEGPRAKLLEGVQALLDDIAYKMEDELGETRQLLIQQNVEDEDESI